MRIMINASSFFFIHYGNQGKENHDKCVILLLSNLGTRERGIITSVSSSFFLIWEPWEVKSLSVRHPSVLGFKNQGKKNHYNCVILLLQTLGTRERRIQ
jgi:hypothetical protein